MQWMTDIELIMVQWLLILAY